MKTTNDLPVGVHSSDIVQLLHRRFGKPVGIWRLRHAASKGYIPEPFKTAAGDHCWRPEDIDRIATYFDDPVPRGRRKNSPSRATHCTDAVRTH